MSSKSRKKASRRGSAGPIAFFVAVFIVALGSIQMAYSFKQADQSDEVKSKSRETSESTATGESDANGTSPESGGQQQTSQDNNQQQSGDQQE